MRFCPLVLRHGAPVAIGSRSSRTGIAWLAVLALAVLPLAARAADDDLPGRVGRIAEFAGQLFLSPQERPADWEEIGINYPITSGDNLWVSGDGRAEVDYGGGQFRVAGDTSVHVSRLDDRQLALFVARGRVIVRVRSLDPGDANRIDTPNTQVALTRPGLYRVDVDPDRESTTVIVREGEAEVALVNGAQQALPGQTVSVVGADPADADIRGSIGVDGFDTWSADRDRRYERGRSTAYVSREMVGYADLDEYGSWQTYQEYGPVWFPTAVAPDWAPYRDGYWTEVGGWGPTWVDRAPWGYAPFHYGRWAWIGGRWGWCPGGYVARPIWAPALVAWVGGPGWGVSMGQRNPVYGWVPLGWGDAYHPHWRQCSHNCWARYNRPYAVNVTVRPAVPAARYRNAGVPGAVSAVAAPALMGRRPVATNLVNVPVSLATSAPALSRAPPMLQGRRPAPTAGSGNAGLPPGASAHVRAPRPGPGSISNASPSGTRSGRQRGDAVAAPTPAPAGTIAQPALTPSPARVQAPAASSPRWSGTFNPAAPAQRESGRAPAPQPQRPRDTAAPSMALPPATGTTQVPSQSVESARPMRREAPPSRQIPVPPVASQPAPAGAGLSPTVAPRTLPGAASQGRGAPAISPGLSGAAVVPAAPSPPPAASRSVPPAGGQPVPVAPANARGGRVPDRPVPDVTPTGVGNAR